jgi:ABC-type sugar transport system ATPase subunit
LSGVYPADAGVLELQGKRYAPASQQEARALGVVTMHQSIADTVVPTLTIADKLLLDRINVNARKRLLDSGVNAALAVEQFYSLYK